MWYKINVGIFGNHRRRAGYVPALTVCLCLFTGFTRGAAWGASEVILTFTPYDKSSAANLPRAQVTALKVLSDPECQAVAGESGGKTLYQCRSLAGWNDTKEQDRLSKLGESWWERVDIEDGAKIHRMDAPSGGGLRGVRSLKTQVQPAINALGDAREGGSRFFDHRGDLQFPKQEIVSGASRRQPSEQLFQSARNASLKNSFRSLKTTSYDPAGWNSSVPSPRRITASSDPIYAAASRRGYSVAQFLPTIRREVEAHFAGSYERVKEKVVALVASIVMAESQGDPNAHGKAKDQGLGQLTPIAIRDLKERLGYRVRNVYDPKQNLKGVVLIVKDLFRQFDGDFMKVAAAYNAGALRVTQWMDNSGTIESPKTSRYVQRVSRYYKKIAEENVRSASLHDVRLLALAQRS